MSISAFKFIILPTLSALQTSATVQNAEIVHNTTLCKPTW